MSRSFFFGLLVLINLAGDLPMQAALIYDNGPPNQTDGFEMTHWIEADDFTLFEAARVENIKFWTFEGVGSFEGSIVWQIYSNGENNGPGTLLFSGTSTNLAHVATGFILFGYAEYMATFDVTPVPLPAGIYWLGLHNGPLTNDTDLGRVYWERTDTAGTRASRARISPFTGPWFSNSFPPGNPSDCAFQVNGSVGPRVTAFALNDGIPKISFTTTVDQNYRVEYKNSFANASWTSVPGAETVPGTGGIVEVADPDPTVETVPQRFYRVELL